MDLDANLKQAIPFFGVSDIQASLRFYVDGLGFTMTKQWTPEGKLQWCWLQAGGAALMLQEFWREGPHAGRPEGQLGVGMSVCFMCEDALAIYRDAVAKGLVASKPFVSNGLWMTSLTDPDGYRVEFESPTDVPEGTECPGP